MMLPKMSKYARIYLVLTMIGSSKVIQLNRLFLWMLLDLCLIFFKKQKTQFQ